MMLGGQPLRAGHPVQPADASDAGGGVFEFLFFQISKVGETYAKRGVEHFRFSISPWRRRPPFERIGRNHGEHPVGLLGFPSEISRRHISGAKSTGFSFGNFPDPKAIDRTGECAPCMDSDSDHIPCNRNSSTIFPISWWKGDHDRINRRRKKTTAEMRRRPISVGSAVRFRDGSSRKFDCLRTDAAH